MVSGRPCSLSLTPFAAAAEVIDSRLEDTEEWSRELENRVLEITEAEHKKEKHTKRKDSLRDL